MKTKYIIYANNKYFATRNSLEEAESFLNEKMWEDGPTVLAYYQWDKIRIDKVTTETVKVIK